MSRGGAFLVAIDGPAGAGKSTVSRRVAERLGFAMVDTGAIYRTVAWAAVRDGIAFDDDAGLAGLLGRIRIEFRPRPGGGQLVFLDGADVSAAIRTPEISRAASSVSARQVVRDGLLELQRRLARGAGKGAVLEGRDIGTVVFPDAEAKFFVTARPDVRAARRHAELSARGDAITLAEVLADQNQRDKDDMERAIAPLRPADDAVVVDTSDLSMDEVVDRIVGEVESRLASGTLRG
ncbi:(d)CMP kinase [Vulgatibacter sp.]|uniref:(d)CMP kinase n=1 Tax=Vulgatibacter sp. TaxID=1971226 RepID=UPI00356236EE